MSLIPQWKTLATKTHAAALLLLLVMGSLCVDFAATTGQTVDETYYNGSGYPMVRYNNYEFLGEHPPLIIQLGALPLLFLQPHFPIHDFVRLPGTNAVDISKTGAMFLYKMGNDPQIILFLERLPVIFLTLILGFGIYRMGREIYGEWGALLALFLYAFMPDVIGNGSLYMTDMGLTVFYFFSIYALKRFFDKLSARRAAVTGIACGLAFMSKISSLILIPAISCLFMVYYWTRNNATPIPEPSAHFQKILCAMALFLVANAIGERQAMVLFGPFLLFALYLMGRDIPRIAGSKPLRILFRILLAAGAVLCVIYSWRLKKKYGVSVATFVSIAMIILIGISAWIARRGPSSDTRIRLTKFYLSLWVLAALVIVLGYTDIAYKIYRFIGFGNFMKPLGIVISHSAGGHGSCLDGSFITCDWRYFLGVIAIKTPLLTLFLSGLGALLLATSHRPAILKAVIFVPIVFFLGAAMTNRINIGLRHILPIFPFFFLLGGLPGAMIANMKSGILKKSFGTALSIALLLLAIRTTQVAPHYLTYFNEAVGGAEEGAKLMAVNWGEDNKALAEFILKKKIPLIKIASESMNADIYNYYKIPWKGCDEKEFVDPMPGFYALGIQTYLAQQKDPQSWFHGKRPEFMAGKTFYIFEVPKK